MKSKRIVVFTGDLSYPVRKGIAEIDRAFPQLNWLILVQRPKKSIAKLLTNQWINLRKNGWRWIPYQVGDILNRLLTRPTVAGSSVGPGSSYTLSAIERAENMRCITVTNIHSSEALAEVESFAPDLGLSLAAPILRRSMFGIPKLGTLNLHKGKVPNYRGMPPAFWELWNEEASVGCTVHCVDDKLDTGDVVREQAIVRSTYSTVRGMQLQLDEVGVTLMRDAVGDFLFDTPSRQVQSSGGKTYRKPTLEQTAVLARRLKFRQVPASSFVVRTAKSTRAALNLACWRVGLNKRFTPQITVLLYHRVSDDVRDNLTVGIEQFNRQMALVRKYCHPLSIGEVTGTATIAKSVKPLVAVTFDDGYRDNFEHAAPILQRHQIPAAFFISTGLIGTDRSFPHDIRRGNAQIPLMTWDQVRRMHSDGFAIGSHTVNHIDCASEPESVVRSELTRSRDDLQRELGLTETWFGYPYGGRQHMTLQRLELVQQAGYKGCLSAYGGRNIGRVDRFNVLRRGIHWEFSDDAFLWECLGLF